MKVTEDYVYFYGTADFLSNFHPSEYCLYGFLFHSVEQGFQWAKAVFFKDQEVAEAILESNCPAECKRLGQLVKNFNDNDWRAINKVIMLEHIMAKFQQNPDIYRQGIDFAKEGKRFAEASKKDKYWGIGLYENDAVKKEGEPWEGENHLGNCLSMFFNGELIKNRWYQNNWPWYDVTEPEEVSEEESADNYFLNEEEDSDE